MPKLTIPQACGLFCTMIGFGQGILGLSKRGGT